MRHLITSLPDCSTPSVISFSHLPICLQFTGEIYLWKSLSKAVDLQIINSFPRDYHVVTLMGLLSSQLNLAIRALPGGLLLFYSNPDFIVT